MDLQTFKFVAALKRCAMDNGCCDPPCPMGQECEGALWMLEKAAGVIKELAARVPDIDVGNKWISVKERLPDDQCDDARAARGGDYIHKVLAVSVTPNYTAMDTAYLYNGRWALGQYTSWKHFMGAPVTHWMPLPVPPKAHEESDGNNQTL